MDSKELLSLILSGKNAEAADAFGSLVTDRINTKIDQMKVDAAASLFDNVKESDDWFWDDDKEHKKAVAKKEKKLKTDVIGGGSDAKAFDRKKKIMNKVVK